MVQHIRKKHPEYAQLPNTIHTPLTTAVISATPAVLTTDSATGETVVVSVSGKPLSFLPACHSSRAEATCLLAFNWLKM